MRTIIALALCFIGLGIPQTSSAQSYAFKRLAGQPGNPGSMDGPAETAQFNQPTGIAVDSQGNVYVCDRANFTIRRISTSGVVTTLAGAAGLPGVEDGPGGSARFADPSSIAIDRAGNLFVADTGNSSIREITATGVVTTFAGQANTAGYVDGPAGTARFTQPINLSIDQSDNLYVSDQDRIRKITPAGIVSTIATGPSPVHGMAVSRDGRIYETSYTQLFELIPRGNSTEVKILRVGIGMEGSAEGTIPTARVVGLPGLVVDDEGAFFATDPRSHAIHRISPSLEVTTIWPEPAKVDSPQLDEPTGIALDRSGNVYVTDLSGSCIYKGTTPSSGRLINLSARAQVETGAGILIAGFITRGVGTKPMVIRGVGPTLSQFGVEPTLARPQITLFNTAGEVEFTNAGWGGNPILSAAFAKVGAFPLLPFSTDAAFLSNVNVGAHTVHLAGVDGTRGVGLAEIYDADPTNPSVRLTNISARSQVGGGSAVLIVGFVVDQGADRVLIRGIGPALAPFGVPGVLANPKLELYQNQTASQIAENDDWGGTSELTRQFEQTGAFALNPSSKDAAIVVTLTPGAYTAILSASDGGLGVGMIELYEAK